MTNPIDPIGGPKPIDGVGPVGKKPVAAPATDPRGPAFEALLERLEQQARDLEETSKSVADSADLAGAVSQAQDSLEAALSFSDRILEAYRETLRRGPDEAEANEASADDPEAADVSPEAADASPEGDAR